LAVFTDEINQRIFNQLQFILIPVCCHGHGKSQKLKNPLKIKVFFFRFQGNSVCY